MRLAVIPDILPPMQHDTGPQSISAVRVLRISVTDRCNFRCVYCMPEQGVRWLARDDILSFEEIAEVVRAAVDLHGIHRFKLTGGEPTVRHGLVDLVRMLRRIEGVEDLSLTTNGMLLSDLAGPLLESGLDRITVSIDSLDSERFKKITRTGDLQTVLRGLDRVADVGFTGTKINCVAMRGSNDDEFPDFARMTLNRALTVRFIEYMPLGDAALMHVPEALATLAPDRFPKPTIADSEQGPAAGCGSQNRGQHAFIPESEIRQTIENEFGELTPVDRGSEPGVGPANVYRVRGAAGRIGFISAMSAPFCSTCNRLRLTADGVLRSCLFEGGEVAIRELLRQPMSIGEKRISLAEAMTDCVRLKPVTHSAHGNQQMSRIGG
jgi:cyclic pyranopterin phosphate synthase